MNNKPSNTEDILDAIRNMMGGNDPSKEESLPNDILELTNPIAEENGVEDTSILQLDNIISEEENRIKDQKEKLHDEIVINEDMIRSIVQKKIELLPSTKIDQIIREELERVISEKVLTAEINFKQKSEV